MKIQNDQLNVIFGFMPAPKPSAKKHQQMAFEPVIGEILPAHLFRYAGSSAQKFFLNTKMLLENTASTTESSSLPVLREVIAALEALNLLEAIYGDINTNSCKIIGIADDLSGDQRDSVWTINWDYQDKYPDINIEILLLQRRGRPLSEVYAKGDSALIKRGLVFA